ncbi:MAG: peptidoglycan DD-metalloendopeptidase family protein [Armatimonadota bacterium]
MLSIIAVFLVVASSPLVIEAKPARRSTKALKRDLHTVNTRIKDMRARLKQTKIQQKNVTDQLISTQRNLETAQSKVIRNKISLNNAQSKLKVINNRLARTERQLERRGKLLSGRISDIYEGEDVSYLEVMLGSRDMKTFLSRRYYIEQIVSSDVELINQYKKDKAQIERDKRAQAKEVKLIASLQSQLIQQRDDVSGLAEDESAQLNAIEQDRELYERALAELMAKSEEIAASIQRYQASRRSTGHYSGKFVGGLMLPVSGRFTSRFGYRIHPVTGNRSLHTGVDIACPSGSQIKAAADGEVIMAGWMGAYGYAVVIDHGGGVSTLYGHNSRLLVHTGQHVKRGTIIARSGSTGWSTGPHCHFEKRINGKPVNPL